MSIASAKKIEQISQALDPKQGILEAIGDISGIDVFADLVLVGTYIRNERTKSGLILPQDTVKEDEHQSKVGLVLKTGPLAYGDWEEGEELGKNAKLHTWVVFAVTNTWKCQINGTPCQFVPYDKLRSRVPRPDIVY